MLLSAMALWQGVVTQSCPEYQKLEAREKEVNKGGTEIRDKQLSFYEGMMKVKGRRESISIYLYLYKNLHQNWSVYFLRSLKKIAAV